MAGKRVTIADVAKATGVSPGAISRILNNDPTLNVREETKETVRRAIAELGYTPIHRRGAYGLHARAALR